MSKSQRVKGHNFERRVAMDFRAIFGSGRRGLQYQDGCWAPDVIIPKLNVECKAHKKAPVRSALRQASEGCPEDKWPVAVLKDDRQPPFVVMYYHDYLKLVSEWWDNLSSTQKDKLHPKGRQIDA